MLKILTVDWTETRRRRCTSNRRLDRSGLRQVESGLKLTGSKRRLASQGLISLFRNYIHAFVGIHLSSDNNGTIIFGLFARISLRVSKPFVSSNLYIATLCFLSFARTDLVAGIFFCKTFNTNSHMAFIIFKFDDFSSFLRIGSGADIIRLIKLEYRLRLSIIINYRSVLLCL